MPSDPIRAVLAGLIDDGTLTAGQAARVEAALRPVLPPSADAKDDRFGNLMAYLGGALVLAAVGVVATLSWHSLGRLGQVALCLGGAAVLLIAAVVLDRARDNRSRRSTVSSLLAALAAPAGGLGVGVATDWLGPGGYNDYPILAGGLGALAMSLPAYVVWRGWPLMLAAWGAGVVVVAYLLSNGPNSWESSGGTLVAFALYGLVFSAAGWLFDDRHIAGTLGGAAIFIAAVGGSTSETWAPLGLGLGIALIAAAFSLFGASRYGGYAVVGTATALVVPAVAMAVLTKNAALVAGILGGVGLLLIVAAIRAAKRPRPAIPAP